MPPFLLAVLASVAATATTALAAPPAARIRAAIARRSFVGSPRDTSRRAPQTVARSWLTPPVSAGPAVPAARPGSAASIAARLAGR